MAQLLKLVGVNLLAVAMLLALAAIAFASQHPEGVAPAAAPAVAGGPALLMAAIPGVLGLFAVGGGLLLRRR